MDSVLNEPQGKESSICGDSKKGSKEGSDKGASGRDPGSVNLESLTEKVGTLGLQRCKCGAAKRRASTARQVEAPTRGESEE
jgi:hypothetical protein